MSAKDFHIVERLSLKGVGAVNEDLTGSFGNCFWIFDGATAVQEKKIDGKYESMPQWFCNEFNVCLKKELSICIPESYSEICATFERTLERLHVKHNAFIKTLAKNEIPSMTISFLSIKPDKISIYSIGDSSVFLLSKNGEINRIHDDRVEPFSSRTLEVFNSYRRNPEKDRYIKEILSSNREKMNTEDGYWVASLDNTWIHKGQYEEISSSAVEAILLCSDGFERSFSLFKNYEPVDILQANISLSQCMEDLRILENLDPDGEKFLRIKKSDDASAILLR